MTKQLLIEILSRRLFVELTLIILTYALVWFVNLNLSFQILGVNVKFIKMAPGVLIGVLYSLYGRQILGNLVYGLTSVCLIVILIKAIGRIPFIKAFWTAVLVVFIIGIGVLAIQEPLCSLSRRNASFFLGTPYGIVAGSLIELLFPAIATLVLSIVPISLVPPFRKQTTLLDCLAVFLFGDMFFIFCNTAIRILLSFKSSARNIPDFNLTSEWAAVIAGGISFYIIITLTRKEHDRERRVFEEEKTELLSKIRELINTNNNLIVDDIVYKIQNVNGAVNGQSNSNVVLTNVNPLQLLLTPREKVVLELVVQGKTNKEIAAEIYLSEGGIKNIITKLLGKLKVEDRTQLAVFAVKNNLVNKG